MSGRPDSETDLISYIPTVDDVPLDFITSDPVRAQALLRYAASLSPIFDAALRAYVDGEQLYSGAHGGVIKTRQAQLEQITEPGPTLVDSSIPASPTSEASFGQPRSLPWEIQALIFAQADPSTLAVLGRVSYDVLAVTAPLLYTEIEVRHNKLSLYDLFCEREEPEDEDAVPSRIDTLLSLSQVRSLHIKSESETSGTILDLALTRLGFPFTPIPLDVLKITIQVTETVLSSLDHLLSTVFHLVNPVKIHLIICGSAKIFHPCGIRCGFNPPSRGLSSRLEGIYLEGGIPIRDEGNGNGALSFLAPGDLEDTVGAEMLGPYTLNLDVNSMIGGDRSTLEDVVGCLADELPEINLGIRRQPDPVLLVDNEAERKEVQGYIEGRELFRVEVKGR